MQIWRKMDMVKVSGLGGPFNMWAMVAMSKLKMRKHLAVVKVLRI